MDTFKLLARSTNLQKTGPVAGKSRQNVPSAGHTSRSATKSEYDNNEIKSSRSSQEPRGTKRKRTSREEVQSPAKSGEHGFPTLPNNPDYRSSLLNANTGVDERPLNETDAPKRSVTVSRQILKQNKLKITVLDDGQQAKNNLASNLSKNPDTAHRNVSTQIYPEPLVSFSELPTRYKISRRLGENLEAQAYRSPTEVQAGSLPLLLGSDQERGLAIGDSRKRKRSTIQNSHIDLLTVAPTGSGKTLAFMINLIHHLLEARRESPVQGAEKSVGHGVQALILAPTHELADQIVNEGRKLALGTGLKVSAMKKGMILQTEASATPKQLQDDSDLESQEQTSDGDSSEPRPAVKSDIVVSTPMLLVNAISNSQSNSPTNLPAIRYLVLDEADVLLDPLFRAQTLGILDACINPLLQLTFWSATIGSSIESLAQSTILSRRRNLGITSPHYLIRVVVGLKDSAIPTITHRLTYAATEQGKLLALRQLLHPTAPSDDKGPSLRPPFLVFTQTIHRAIALHSELRYDIPPEAGGSSRIAVLHSDLSDSARAAIMAGFRKGEIWILITTDLLSRGMDFRGMNGVVNYDIPTTGASYVHRAGRTGRQGREGGVAVTLYTKEDIPYVKNVANVIAAGERARSKSKAKGDGTEDSEGQEEGGVQKWLLDALPRVSKKAKRELKLRGVESRRGFGDGPKEKERRRARISTKSGYDRRMENRRKGAAKGVHQRGVREAEDGNEDEWGGFED